MPVVIVPEAYQGPTQGQERVTVEGTSVRAALDEMAKRFPGLEPLLRTEDGKLQRFVSVFLNGEGVLNADLDRAVEANDEIEILTALAGG